MGNDFLARNDWHLFLCCPCMQCKICQWVIINNFECYSCCYMSLWSAQFSWIKYWRLHKSSSWHHSKYFLKKFIFSSISSQKPWTVCYLYIGTSFWRNFSWPFPSCSPPSLWTNEEAWKESRWLYHTSCRKITRWFAN